jgi:hypothetical protein
VNRLIVLTVIALFCATLVSVTTCGLVLAQSGSTGGTLGKTDKSMSGEREDQASPPIRSKPRSKTTAMPANKGTHTFQNPMSHGMATDLCQTAAATGCGEPSATMWCQRSGYARATSYNYTISAPAWRQGEGTRCTGPCGVLTQVTCE